MSGFCQDSLAKVEVMVTDFQNEPRVGEQILFVGKTKNIEFSGVSGDDGKFIVKLVGGETYDIKIKSVGISTDYSTLEIPALDKGELYTEAQLTLQFELPKTFTLNNVQFDSGKSSLKKESFIELKQLYEYLTYKKTIKIEVAGHTDNVGDESGNMRLSQQRADKVKAYLVAKGVSSSRIMAKGYGETKPISENNSEEGKAKNRRTEVHILSE